MAQVHAHTHLHVCSLTCKIKVRTLFNLIGKERGGKGGKDVGSRKREEWRQKKKGARKGDRFPPLLETTESRGLETVLREL